MKSHRIGKPKAVRRPSEPSVARRKLLVPADFSAASDKALHYVVVRARAGQSRKTLRTQEGKS